MNSPEIYTAIVNYNALTLVCGKWPSFRGAELVAMRLGTQGGKASIEADLENGAFVTFCFDYVDDVELEDWSHQNVLRDLEIEYDEDEKMFEVEFSSSNGCAAEFRCIRISVVSVKARSETPN